MLQWPTVILQSCTSPFILRKTFSTWSVKWTKHIEYFCMWAEIMKFCENHLILCSSWTQQLYNVIVVRNVKLMFLFYISQQKYCNSQLFLNWWFSYQILNIIYIYIYAFTIKSNIVETWNENFIIFFPLLLLVLIN